MNGDVCPQSDDHYHHFVYPDSVDYDYDEDTNEWGVTVIAYCIWCGKALKWRGTIQLVT